MTANDVYMTSVNVDVPGGGGGGGGGGGLGFRGVGAIQGSMFFRSQG